MIKALLDGNLQVFLIVRLLLSRSEPEEHETTTPQTIGDVNKASLPQSRLAHMPYIYALFGITSQLFADTFLQKIEKKH